jgi:SAM-dependent methyltransferase
MFHPTDNRLRTATPDFSRLARPYRWMEYATFGPWLFRARCLYLPAVNGRRRALILGDGDGRFTARLLRTNPAIQIHAVDASPAMLGALVRRAGADADRVCTQLADARIWRPATPNGPDPLYDAIFTHFFLDCLTTEEVQSLAEGIRRAVAPSAVWVVSEFAIPAGWYGRLVAQPLIWSLYRVFGCLTGLAVRTLPDHHSALRAAGFILHDRRTWLGGLLTSERWSAVPADKP